MHDVLDILFSVWRSGRSPAGFPPCAGKLFAPSSVNSKPDVESAARASAMHLLSEFWLVILVEAIQESNQMT